MSNTTTNENAVTETLGEIILRNHRNNVVTDAQRPAYDAMIARDAQTLKLIKKDGMILAPLPDEYTGDTDTLLCTCNEHGEAVVPREAGEDLDRCLYDLRNSNTEAGKLPDGTTVELDGRIVGHFNGCHFIPAH